MTAHASNIVGRTLAGIVAAFAFYTAIFLFEDQEGVWQNRIDLLWCSIFDRAKLTDNVTTALFNKIGDTLRKILNRVFGKRLLSFQAVVTSMNLSLGAAFWSLALVEVVPDFQSDEIHEAIRYFAYGCVFIVLAVLIAYFPKKWVIALSALPSIGLIVAILADLDQALGIDIYISQDFDHRIFPFVLLASMLSDYLAVTVIRKLFVSISEALTIGRATLMVGMLIGCSVLTMVFPFYMDESPAFESFHTGFWITLFLFNISTGLVCLLFVFVLVGILVHKLMWPFLSRLTYPLSRFKIVTNRKVLLPLGSVCLIYALNIEHLGMQAILKLWFGE